MRLIKPNQKPLTVGELIEKLKDCPQDYYVHFSDNDCCLVDVRSVKVNEKMKWVVVDD